MSSLTMTCWSNPMKNWTGRNRSPPDPMVRVELLMDDGYHSHEGRVLAVDHAVRKAVHQNAAVLPVNPGSHRREFTE